MGRGAKFEFCDRCLGSTQHLKNKYGGGYMLEMKLKQTGSNDWAVVEAEVMAHFADTLLSEAFADRRMYSIPQNSVVSLATTFSKLESCEFHAFFRTPGQTVQITR